MAKQRGHVQAQAATPVRGEERDAQMDEVVIVGD